MAFRIRRKGQTSGFAFVKKGAKSLQKAGQATKFSSVDEAKKFKNRAGLKNVVLVSTKTGKTVPFSNKRRRR